MKNYVQATKGIILGLFVVVGISLVQAEATTTPAMQDLQMGSTLITQKGISTNVFHARQNALFEQSISVGGSMSANGNVFGQNMRAVENIHAGESLLGHDGYFVDTVGIGTNATLDKITPGVRLDIDGKVGATYYCDRKGENCMQPREIKNILPSGAVNSFDLKECPFGWSFYAQDGKLIQCRKN